MRIERYTSRRVIAAVLCLVLFPLAPAAGRAGFGDFLQKFAVQLGKLNENMSKAGENLRNNIAAHKPVSETWKRFNEDLGSANAANEEYRKQTTAAFVQWLKELPLLLPKAIAEIWSRFVEALAKLCGGAHHPSPQPQPQPQEQPAAQEEPAETPQPAEQPQGEEPAEAPHTAEQQEGTPADSGEEDPLQARAEVHSIGAAEAPDAVSRKLENEMQALEPAEALDFVVRYERLVEGTRNGIEAALENARQLADGEKEAVEVLEKKLEVLENSIAALHAMLLDKVENLTAGADAGKTEDALLEKLKSRIRKLEKEWCVLPSQARRLLRQLELRLGGFPVPEE